MHRLECYVVWIQKRNKCPWIEIKWETDKDMCDRRQLINKKNVSEYVNGKNDNREKIT